MPKFDANLSMLFTEVDFLDRLDAAAKAGFKGVEYLFPYDFSKDELVERLQRNGLTQVLHNLPAGDAEHRIDSEYWHRDNHDRKIVKLYVYLNDVDEHTGPLTFLRQTQAGGAYGSVFPAHPPEGSYPNEKALIGAVPESRMVRCTGPAGTVVLCDTMGFHKGGRCARKHRLLLTATYTSDAALDYSRYRLAQPEQLAQLGPMARYAIRAPFPTD